MSVDISDIDELTGKWLAYRQVADGWPPLWLPESKKSPAAPSSARWHRQGENVAQYLSLSPTGSWCERIHADEIKRAEDLEHLALDLWELLVIERRIADLSTFAKAYDAGIDPEILVAPEQRPCQNLRETLEAAGFRGVLSPSAAVLTHDPEFWGDDGHLNLTLFGPRHAWPPGQRNRNSDYFVTCRQVAIRTRPPAQLLQIARYPGDPCLDLDEWRRTAASW